MMNPLSTVALVAILASAFLGEGQRAEGADNKCPTACVVGAVAPATLGLITGTTTAISKRTSSLACCGFCYNKSKGPYYQLVGNTCSCLANCTGVTHPTSGASSWGNLKSCDPFDMPSTCSALMTKMPKRCPGVSSITLIKPHATSPLRYQCCCEAPNKARTVRRGKRTMMVNCVPPP